jgi:hypothetical protein
MTMRKQKWISRVDLQNNFDVCYIFGDNLAKKGMGGQAKEMRGEENAFGIPTKVRPDYNAGAFMDDSPEYHTVVKTGFDLVEGLLMHGYEVVFPLDGIGTDRAKLSIYAPKLLRYISERTDELYDKFGPENHHRDSVGVTRESGT